MKTKRILSFILAAVILCLPISANGETSLQLSNFSLSSGKFDPTAGTLKINFSTNSQCVVYCGIYDANDNEIATVSDGGNVPDAGRWSLTWKGTGSNGKYVPAGKYTVGLALSDEYGNTTEPEGLNVEVFYQAKADTSGNRIVTFKDKTLERVIRDDINKEQGNILQSDVQKITKLEMNYQLEGYDVIRDLSGIEKLTNLTVLNLGNESDIQKVTSLEPLRNLKNLTELYLDHNLVSSLEPISGLRKLRVLHIGGNKVSNIEPLRNLTNLEKLYIGIEAINGGNNVSDLSPLSGLVNLKELGLYGNNGITGIDALKGMTKLTYLNLRGPRIRSISALAGMKNLRHLDIGANNSKVSDISVLKNLSEIRELDISYNKITTVEPLRYLTKLESLSIAGNNIRKLEPLGGLVNLKSFYIGTSCAGGNPVTDFSVLKNFRNMDTLDLEYMNLKNINFLAGLTKLKWLDIKNNSITSIEPLRGMTNLKYLYLKNNSINDFSPVNGIMGKLLESDINE